MSVCETTHGKDCRCTYCDKETQANFEKFLKATATSEGDGLGAVVPKIYAFEGQTEKQAKKLLEGEKLRPAGAAAPQAKKLLEGEKLRPAGAAAPSGGEVESFPTFINIKSETLKGITPEPGGVGKTKPDIYTFVNQTKDAVKELLKIDFSNMTKAWKESNNLFPDHKTEPKLTFDDEMKRSDNGQPILPRVKPGEAKDRIADEECCALWRKLSGVKPNEIVPEKGVTDRLTNAIKKRIQNKFKGLDVRWSSDCYNRCLVINGAYTCVRTDKLHETYNGLCQMTSHEEAVKIVANIVIKKLNGLFI